MSWNHIWSIAQKELRGYFNSAVALIFLGTFLAVTLFTFFWVDKFFTRGIADVRPMFEWLPILLIFLVAALTMRLWSEEQKVGTIEVLLTLPVRLHELVLGKFLAGFLLIAIALGLTLGLPITVSLMGELDWGPVVGGYLAALLLAAAYLSIGLCVSASTDNQIVSLVLTALFCGILYVPGTSAVTGGAGYDLGELLRSLGTGSRFDSIARGVIDLRDLAYWGSLVVFFLSLNTVLLMAKRWSAGKRTFAQRQNAKIAVFLIALNVVALNVWLAPVARARVDLTEDKRYSLSEVTEDLLGKLDEPLLIRGYFSEKQHEKLGPLVPQIRDLLKEYKVAGGESVRLEFVDPSDDEELQKEAYENFGIESQPFRLSSRNVKGVVNAYFHILVKYGDQHEVLSVGDLIEQVPIEGGKDTLVRLRNFEYDLTKTIKKVVYGFGSLEALFASMSEDAKLTFFVTPSLLPQNFKDGPAKVKAVVEELAEKSGGKLEFERREVSGLEEGQRPTYEGRKIDPYATLFSQSAFYFHLVLDVGDKVELVPLPNELTETKIREAVQSTLERAAPGFLKTVGLWTPPPKTQQPRMRGMRPQQQPTQPFQNLRQRLSENYQVRKVNLKSGQVDDGIDVLVVAGPENLNEKQQRAVDQFLMRGGSVILFAGRYRFDLQKLQQNQIGVSKVETGLDDLLGHYGVEVKDQMVLDTSNITIPRPVKTAYGGRPRIVDTPYPYFVRVEHERIAEESIVTAGLNAAILHWASPLSVDEGLLKKGEEEDGVRAEVLLRSSGEAWLEDVKSVQGVPKRPESVPEDQRGPHPLAISLVGSFDSYFAGKGQEGDEEKEKGEKEDGEQLLQSSPPGTRLAVIGSSAFVDDIGYGIARQFGARAVEQNLVLVQNLVDWGVEDTDLLSIRARGTQTHVLDVEEDARQHWEFINYGIMVLALALVVGVSVIRRRALEPMPLDPPSGKSAAAAATRGAEADEEDADEGEDEDEDEDEENDEEGEER